ncbi:hypothetical protein MKW98_030003, partial [Papaver atlanticum]
LNQQVTESEWETLIFKGTPQNTETKYRLWEMISWSPTQRELRKQSKRSYEMPFFSRFNQIGSVTENIEALMMSKEAGWGVMTSHRSGETEDTFIADLAIGLATLNFQTDWSCVLV